MPEAQDTRLPRASARAAATPSNQGPLWARATRLFYGESLDVRSKGAFVASMDEFVGLTAGEQHFHLAQLQFRQIQALEDIHGLLKRIAGRLDGLDPKAIAGLAELPKIRRVLKQLAEGQADLMELTEFQGEGEELPDDDDEEPAGEQDGEDPDFIYDDIPDDNGQGGANEPLEGELVPNDTPRAQPPGVPA